MLRRGELTAVYVVQGERFVLRAVRTGANRGGAGTRIGVQNVATSPADGYSLLFAGVGQVLNPIFGPEPPFELLGALEPVSLVSRIPFIVAANRNVAFNSPRELIAAAKAAPGSAAPRKPSTLT